MTKVHVGVGSNINPKKNLRLAIQKLQERFGALNISPAYKSNSVGFVGEDFLNLVIGFVTYESIENVLKIIETLHQLSGRKRTHEKFLSRALDIDLLLYGNLIYKSELVTIPRPDILEYSFVLKPLSAVAPDIIHPQTKKTIQEHWQIMNKKKNSLEMIDLKIT